MDTWNADQLLVDVLDAIHMEETKRILVAQQNPLKRVNPPLYKDPVPQNTLFPQTITAYFVDMERVIREWYKVLSPSAKVAMVVDNARFEGEMVPVDLILSDMAEKVGFTVREIIVARYKGNSAQQMKKYGKVPVRESIVIWER